MKIINIDVDSELIVKNVYDTESKVEKNDSNSLKIPTGNYKTIMLNFNFISPKFEEADLKLFASFNNDFLDKPVMAEVTSIVEAGTTYNHACYIPGELLRNTGKVKLGLFGYILNEETQELEKRYSLQPISSEVVLGSFQEDMVNAATPTPTVFELYFQQVKDMADQVAKDYELVRTAIKNVKNENIDDFNKKAEAKKTSLISDFDTHATEKEEEVKGNIDSHVAGKIEEYDEHAEELISSVADTRNELERVKNDILETGEASDTSIHLEDSAMAEMQELAVDGTHKQITTTGKNVFDLNKDTHKASDVTIIDSNSYSSTTGATWKGQVKVPCNVEKNEAYVISFLCDNSKTNPYVIIKNSSNEKIIEKYMNEYPNGLTFNTGENEKIDVVLHTNGNYNTSEKITLSNIQLEKGTVKTDFEPYSGGEASPSPNYPQEIEVIEEDFDVTSCGKNFFDLEKYPFCENTAYTSKGELVVWLEYSGIKDYFPVKPNTTYTFSNSTGKKIACGLVCYDKDKNIISAISAEIQTFTTPSNCKYIRFAINSIELPTWVQIELGDKATEYEPYQETKVTFELPEGEFFGSVSDTIKDEAKIVFNEEDGQYHKIIEKNVGKVVLDGSEDEIWVIGTTNDSDKKRFRFSSQNLNIKKAESVREKVKGLSNLFVPTTPDDTWFNRNGFCIDTSGHLFFYDENLCGYSLEEFKQRLSENNVIVYCQLAEPYTLDLGVVDMPLSYYPVTNVSTNHNLHPNINVKYYRNFISTIKNLQVNERALKQELVDINSRLSALENSLINIASEVNESEVVE